jgi:hypothetical protein
MIELNQKIQFPMLTFNNDLYSEFMIGIMRCLEINYIEKDTMIAKELDECN